MRNVRFGSKADICSATGHVRFAPNSDRKSGFPYKVMSALPPKADICSAPAHVCFGPIADIGNNYVAGRNLKMAMSAIRTKIANTTTCVRANGGSDCVGANALRADTFTKLCTTRTKIFKYSDATAVIT